MICFEEDSASAVLLADAQAAFFGQLYAILDQLGTATTAHRFSDEHNGGFRAGCSRLQANRDGKPARWPSSSWWKP
ncbi:MAG: hypothetical protein ACLSAH_17620 [Bilophila wadsworthia]